MNALKAWWRLKDLLWYLIRVAPFAGVILNLGCMEVPSPYFVNINGKILAFPSEYISEADMGRDRAKSRELARAAPGLSVDGIHFILEYDGSLALRPWKRKSVDIVRVWIFDSINYPAGSQPSALSSRYLRPENRILKEDKFGLEAFGDVNGRYINSLYFVSSKTAQDIFIRCHGFGLPNPICKATILRQGLLINYEYSSNRLLKY